MRSTVPIPSCARGCSTGSLPRRAWQRRSVGMGAKGSALVFLGAHRHHRQRRRRRGWSASPAGAPQRQDQRVGLLPLLQPHTADYVRAAGWRWKAEESFQTGKELAGLDEHQVRRWTSWHRWVTLAMLAHAFLVVTTAAQRCADTVGTTLIALTVNEFRRLFDALLLRPLHAVAGVLAWSTWRRKHEAIARACHHRKHHQHQ